MSLKKTPTANVISANATRTDSDAPLKVVVTESVNLKGSPTKMSDLFTMLPHGVFDKSITGLGGTSLELDSKRPSIVVEPLNITAFTKAQKPSRTRKFKIHYYGTGIPKDMPAHHKLMLMSVRKNSALEGYLRRCKESATIPKIICVSDQLAELRSKINSLGIYKFSDFHLLLDEIDSMQEQNDFRAVMEDCVQIYKEHPKKRRTMLSATINRFHDPELRDEPWTKILFEDFRPIPTVLHHSLNHPYRIAVLTKEILESDSNAKVVIAQNHISGIKETIKILTESFDVSSSEIRVMSSDASRNEFPDYAHKLDDGALPAKVNFITAAYFSGLDIDANAHLIISADARTKTLQLSANALYQIQGRLRKGVDSCQIVCAFVFPSREQYKSEEVLEAVEIYKPTIALFSTFKKSSNKFLQKHAEVLENLFTNGFEDFRSIWTKEKGELKISFLKIDSFIEDEKTRFAMSTDKTFKESISKYFNIISEHKHDDKSNSKVQHSKDAVLEVLRAIKGLDLQNPADKARLVKLSKEQKAGFTKAIVQMALRAFGKNVFNLTELLPQVEKLVIDTEKWEPMLNHLFRHVHFHSLVTFSSDLAMKHFMYTHFARVGEMPSQAFNELVKVSLDELGTLAQIKNLDFRILLKDLTAQQFIKANMTINSRRDNKGNYKTITSFNPYGILNLSEYKELDMEVLASGEELFPLEWVTLATIMEDGTIDTTPRITTVDPTKKKKEKAKQDVEKVQSKPTKSIQLENLQNSAPQDLDI